MNPPPVDWNAVLAELRARGLLVREIARALNVNAAMPMRWGDGTQNPNYTNGERLVLLWVRTTGRPASEVPRTH